MSDDLRTGDLVERVAAIDVIAARGTATADEIAGLVECLGDERKPVQRRAADALAVLHRAGSPVAPAIAGALAASTLRHRWGAAYALGLLGCAGVEVIPILLDVLASDDGDRRWAAAQMLVGFGEQPLVTSGLRTCLRAADPTARKMALYCLRDLGRPWEGSDDALLAALSDTDSTVRLAALGAASALAVDRERVARACVERLDDETAGVSRAAAATLGQLGSATPEVLAGLDRAAVGPDLPRARAARTALARLAGGAGPV